MSLTPEQRRELKPVYQRVSDGPLEPDDPLYEPLYERPDASEDPVELLLQHIEWSEVESLQLFSGFRGSGKTTELFRLRRTLLENGYLVIYANALDYLSPSEPVDIVDLLLVIAGAFSDALERPESEGGIGISIGQETYWNRFQKFLQSEIELREITIKNEIAVPDSLKWLVSGKTGTDVKIALKSTPTFRQNLQTFLADRLGLLRRNVTEFIEFGIKEVRRAKSDDTQVVFLFDQLEQIRGSRSNESEVIHSVERLFAAHLSDLRLPYVHTVYTVPPWLKFVLPNVSHITILPGIRLWDNDARRTRCSSGWKALRSLVQRRIGSQDDIAMLFGPADAEGNNPHIDLLIEHCGGHIRDLLLLLRETLLRARELPISASTVEHALTSVREDFLPLAVSDAQWLKKIADNRDACLPDATAASVGRLSHFLDTHLVLYFTNGSGWYDVHPMIREEIDEINKREMANTTVGETPRV